MFACSSSDENCHMINEEIDIFLLKLHLILGNLSLLGASNPIEMLKRIPRTFEHYKTINSIFSNA
jgi:hypothetical protein